MAAVATRVLSIEHACCSDDWVIEQVKAGRTGLFEIVMRRYSQRLYRVAYSILRDQAEAEDAIQETYLRAFQFLQQFAGRAKFSTWLTRIAVHEALARTHRRDRYVPLDLEIRIIANSDTHSGSLRSPEQAAANSELGAILRGAIAALPSHYRAVLELRDIHEVSTEEAAGRLQISPENVKIRLHRARAMVRRRLLAYIPVGALSGATSRARSGIPAA